MNKFTDDGNSMDLRAPVPKMPTADEMFDEIDRMTGISALDALIEAAPEIPETIPAVESGPSVTMKGWDARHLKLSEPTGDEWLATFDQARKAVKDCGLVALIGDRGTGKTQMAANIAQAGGWPCDDGKWNGHRNIRDHTALYVRAMDIFLDLRDSNKKDSKTSEKEVLGRLVEVGLLVIDEFQERGESEWENRVLTNLIDKRYAAEKPTLIIANYDRQQLSNALSPSIKDRMHENGRSFLFTWGSYRRNKP